MMNGSFLTRVTESDWFFACVSESDWLFAFAKTQNSQDILYIDIRAIQGLRMRIKMKVLV